jgi:4-amino-4-deoxy-L-arabinose transferase-like glycosyltransferase
MVSPKLQRGYLASSPSQLILWFVIVLVAAGVRLYGLDRSPPGLQVDEVASAYNAKCLLKTGMDWEGKSWPILHSRCYGEYPSPIYMYALLPFQAVGGMNVITTRLPTALAGLATIVLLYYLGRRLMGPLAGLIAAALLTVCPWHMLLSRLGVPVGLVARRC